MDSEKLEQLTKTSQSADLFLADLKEMRKAVSGTDPALSMVIGDLIRDAGVIKQRLAELETAYR